MNESFLVPMELQNELLALRDGMTGISWRVGDITNYVLRHNEVNNLGASQEECYKAVASLWGKKSRTVREYGMVSGFYPVEIREAYNVLAFDHFRIAMRMKDKWRDALEWAMDRFISTGKPATIDAMLANFASGEAQFTDEIPADHLKVLLGVPGMVRTALEGYRNQVPNGLMNNAYQALDLLDASLRDIMTVINQV